MNKIKALFPPPLITLIVYISIIVAIILSLKHLTILSVPIFFSFAIAYLFNPLANFLEKNTVLSRPLASAILMVLFVLILVFLFINLLPYVLDQIASAAKKIPQILEKFSANANVFSNYLTKHFSEYIGNIDIMGKIEEMISSGLTDISKLLTSIFTSIYGLILTLLYLVFIPLFSYYFLKDYYKIKRIFFEMIPQRVRPNVTRKLESLDHVLSSFIRGQAIVVIILAILYSTGLSIIGLPFAILIGIFSGILDFIPYFGTVLGFIASLIVGLAHFQSWEQTLLIVLIFSIVKGSENWFFYPKIVGKEVGLHFVWVLVSIIVFGQLFGFWGLLVAIPSSAGLKIFLRDCVAYYKKSNYFQKR